MKRLSSAFCGALGLFSCAFACSGGDGAAADGATSFAGSSSGASASSSVAGASSSAGGAPASVGASSGGNAGLGGAVNGGESNAGGVAQGGVAQAGANSGGAPAAGSAGAAGASSAGAAGLDPSAPPGKNFDLSHFVLQLPIADGSSVKQIPQSALATYTSTYFYTGTDGAMVFWCPVTGAHTPNTHYPRTELRETAVGGDWQITGKHSLSAKFEVTQVPPSKGTIIGQIHGNATDGTAEVLKLEWLSTNAIIASVEKNDSPSVQVDLPLGNYTLGSEYTYLIQLENSNLTVTITDAQGVSKSITSPYTAASWKNDQYYFKLGDYVQLNTGADTDGGRVSFYSFTITHG